MNYEKAKEELGKRTSRKLAHNTYLQSRPDGVIVVRLHETDTVSYNPDGSVRYNSGGWKTVTTKDRMNRWGADTIYIHQKNRTWYIGNDRKTAVYADGITVGKRGGFHGGGNESKEQGLRRQVKKYCNDYVRALLDGKVSAPSSGDCWYCCMHTDNGKSLGDSLHNNSHIKDHMEESYFVPSLLMNASKLYPMSPLVKVWIGELWQGKKGKEWGDRLVARQAGSSLKRYLHHRLGLVI